MAGCQAPPVNAGRFQMRFRKSEIRNPKFRWAGVGCLSINLRELRASLGWWVEEQMR